MKDGFISLNLHAFASARVTNACPRFVSKAGRLRPVSVVTSGERSGSHAILIKKKRIKPGQRQNQLTSNFMLLPGLYKRNSEKKEKEKTFYR